MLYNDETFLNDKEFLRLLDLERNKEVFAKIVSLDFSENPLEEIEGRVTQGSVNVDGTSSVRRTCSLSLAASELNIHEFYWGLNTKFKLYAGVKNELKERQPYKEKYAHYPDICWFKMGTYIISSFSTSQSTNSYTISISGKDKMSFLNGEVGGVITPLSWDFGKIDEVDANGMISTKDYKIKDIILEAVHEHAQEPYWNIIINDLDECGLELLEYRGQSPLYLLNNITQGTVTQMSLDLPMDFIATKPGVTEDNIKFDHQMTYLNLDDEIPCDIFYNPADISNHVPIEQRNKYTIIEVNYGDTIGYRTTELTYAGDLISNVGETVTSMLDKIVSMLGAFEYFYDLNGRFIFQRKKTYIQSTFSTITKNDNASNEIYIENAAGTSAFTYSFDNSLLITSFSNSPNFSDLKNDYSLWGVRKGISGIEIPIHLRYAIDTKPWMYINYNGLIFVTEEGQEKYKQLMKTYAEWIKLLKLEAAQAAGKTIFTKAPVPECLQTKDAQGNPTGTSDWWDITNWATYYLLLTGSLPNEKIGNYGTEAFTGLLTFPDGTTYNCQSHPQLVIDLTRDTHNPFYSNADGGYYNPHNNQYQANGRWSPFQHGFNGCNHTYGQFLDLDANNNCQSFIYKPQIPQAIVTDEIIANIDDIVIVDEDMELDMDITTVCDWREIIYQMSLDYNKYHHNSDFLVKIDQNNTLPDQTHLYLNGYTGYEQYYIDLNGFWRTLYDPFYRYSYQVVAPNKSKYAAQRDATTVSGVNYPNGRFFVYQSCDGYSYAEMTAAVTAWRNYLGRNLSATEKNKLEILYKYNYKNQLQPLSSIPDEATYNKEPKKYCFIRACQRIGNTKATQALDYDIHTVYHEQITDEYDPVNHWSYDLIDSPEGINFWFDFLDTEDSRISQYKVCKIGDRTKANNDTNIKSIYYRDVPTVIFVGENATVAEEKAKKGTGYTYIKLPHNYENLFSMSSQGKSAMDVLNDWLYSYAYCAESISINALPVYYLEPNTRIFVRDDNSGINGEYIVTRLTFPLGHNGTMSITATKAVENLY